MVGLPLSPFWPITVDPYRGGSISLMPGATSTPPGARHVSRILRRRREEADVRRKGAVGMSTQVVVTLPDDLYAQAQHWAA
jgi:hypothetical protein